MRDFDSPCPRCGHGSVAEGTNDVCGNCKKKRQEITKKSILEMIERIEEFLKDSPPVSGTLAWHESPKRRKKKKEGNE